MTLDYETVGAVNECLPVLGQYYRVIDLGDSIIAESCPGGMGCECKALGEVWDRMVST